VKRRTTVSRRDVDPYAIGVACRQCGLTTQEPHDGDDADCRRRGYEVRADADARIDAADGGARDRWNPRPVATGFGPPDTVL
jgi:hypothetical protein